jgi:hypothetical protein
MRNDNNGSGGRDRYGRPPQPADRREKASERFEKPESWDSERMTPEQRKDWLYRRAKGDHQ